MNDTPTTPTTDLTQIAAGLRNHVDGSLGLVTLCTLEDRRDAVVFADKVAGVIELRAGGPCRVLFTGGGALDVCGAAEIIWRCVRIAELEAAAGPVA